MDKSLTVERYYIRLFLGIVAGIFLLVLLGWGGHRIFVRWQERRLMRQAHAFALRGEDQWAALAAQRAYRLDPANVDACRTLGDLSEKQGDVNALDWRRRVVELERSPQNILQLAGCALRFNRVPVATDALAKMTAAEKEDAGYHAVAARVALAQNNGPLAETHLIEALRRAPQDPEHQLELALFHINAREEPVREKGRAELERLQETPIVRGRALRALVQAEASAGHNSAALRASGALLTQPEATFADRIVNLELLRSGEHTEFAARLSALEAEAGTSTEKVAQVLSWLNAQGLPLLALDWVKRLPEDLLARRPIPVLVADGYMALSEWSSLQAWCRKGTWQDREFLRHSVLARATRELGDRPGFEAEWAAALKDAGTNAAHLSLLQQNVTQWGWEQQATDLLWLLAKDPGKQADALDQLYQACARKGDAAGLYRVLLNEIQIKPADSTIKNNLAQLSLILNSDVAQGHRLARELYESDPHNPAFVSTFAFSLSVEGKDKEALRTIETLSAEQLHDPSIAAYYGILLAASHDSRAREFLELGLKARLLPEETALVKKAQRSLPAN